MATTQPIPLDVIFSDADLWPRDALDDERVAEFTALYKERGPSALPPVVLALDPDPDPETLHHGWVYLIPVDGWHRLAAWEAAGVGEEIPAVVRDDLTSRGAIFAEAVRLAVASAKPLTASERRQAIASLVGMAPDLSDREIAKRTGVSYMTVNRIRHRADPAGDPDDDDDEAAPPVRRERPSIADRFAILLLSDDAGDLEVGALQQALLRRNERMKRDYGALTSLIRGCAAVLAGVAQW